MNRLKLKCTYLNYRVQGTSTAAIFLSNDNSLYALINLGWIYMNAWFHSYGISRLARSTSKATKYKTKNSCTQWDSNPQPWDLNEVLCSTDWANRSWWKLYYINDLCTHIYFRYQCIHWYKFANDGVERILSCKWTILCYIKDFLECEAFEAKRFRNISCTWCDRRTYRQTNQHVHSNILVPLLLRNGHKYKTLSVFANLTDYINVFSSCNRRWIFKSVSTLSHICIILPQQKTHCFSKPFINMNNFWQALEIAGDLRYSSPED